MFTHRKIESPKVDHVWRKLKITINPEIAYKAAEVLGQCAAEDMLNFAKIDESYVKKIYVKYRDGLPMAVGIKKIIPKSDIIYITTQRFGSGNQDVDITIPLETRTRQADFDQIAWFADPINARGTTAVGGTKEVKRINSFRYCIDISYCGK